MIAEGRRQYDEQVAHLERIRDRAKWLITVTFAIGTALAAIAPDAFDDAWSFRVWLLAAVTTTYSALGAVSILTGRADFDGIATKVLASYAPPIRPRLTRDYAEMLELGDLTVATRLTLFRQAVVWTLIGSYATLAAFLLSI
jgi:hypothetical protein